MAVSLTEQVRNIAEVTTAVANGDLSKKITVDVRGEILELKNTINTMVDQLNAFAAEVTRVAREVGTDGKLGGQAIVPGVAGTWKDLTDSVNAMSHELRTPLNSILILGQQLAENPTGSLTTKQVDFARNIHSAGTDLLTLINDILDLSKIESGTVTVEAEEMTFGALRDSVQRTFHHVAESKSLQFYVDIDSTLPRTFTSDPKRLQQILKNLLSNAFKFTAQGYVSLSIRHVTSGWNADHPVLGTAGAAIAFMMNSQAASPRAMHAISRPCTSIWNASLHQPAE